LCQVPGPGSGTSTHVTQRDLSTRFSTRRFSLPELKRIASEQFVCAPSSQSRRRQPPRVPQEFPPTPMQQHLHNTINRLLLPAGKPAKLLLPYHRCRPKVEWIYRSHARSKFWVGCSQFHRPKSPSSLVKELGSGRLYPIDVYLSDKIFTPCVVKEENFARCKVDQQCFHCQCGCDQLVCQCDSPEQRKYSFVHIVDYLYRRYRFKSYRSPSPYIRNKEAYAWTRRHQAGVLGQLLVVD